jgi:tRNA(fMet)-specific endonuclease VapC
MFVILDTNHYREMLHETELGGKLSERLRERDADAFTTIVTVQEITQGWTAEINRCKTGRDQVRAYAQFENAIHDFADITIFSFDRRHRLLPWGASPVAKSAGLHAGA